MDGLVIFSEPKRFRRVDWIYEHLDCDAIVTKESAGASFVDIVCFAKSKEYNKDLRQLRDSEYKGYVIMQGVSSRRVDCNIGFR